MLANNDEPENDLIGNERFIIPGLNESLGGINHKLKSHSKYYESLSGDISGTLKPGKMKIISEESSN